VLYRRELAAAFLRESLIWINPKLFGSWFG